MIRNIEDKFLQAELDCFIETDWGRIYLNTNDQPRGISILSKVFGITSISPVHMVSNKIEEITDTVVEYAERLLKNGQTFALRTRRTGKHNYTSMELAQVVGKAILERLKDKKLKVNLTAPSTEIHIEVRNKHSYIFSEFFTGPGGLPLGTQGKVISVFTDECSYIATWLMMKRGCRAFPVFFRTDEKSSAAIEANAREQIELLRPWAANINLKVIDLPSSAKNSTKSNYLDNVEFLNYAHMVKAIGVCHSYDLGTFKSSSTNLKNDFPIFYPLIGLDEGMIQDLGNKIKKVTTEK
jgi:thiamine biosynthesis protein ThiI